MHRNWTFLPIGACLLGAAPVSSPVQPRAPSPPSSSGFVLDENPDPVAAAVAAARSGHFGLVVGGGWGSRMPPGIICFTPFGQAPATRADVSFGDVITPEVAASQSYATAYNRALVDQPGYPDADLCRAILPAEVSRRHSPSDVSRPARPVTGPPRTLFEAARRGKVADAKHFLPTQSINAVDGVGMTPLAWATARNNLPVVELLIAQAADPWAASDSSSGSSVYWAAKLGRTALFDRLVLLGYRPFKIWPRRFVEAAAIGGSVQITRHILAEPHEPYQSAGNFPPAQTMALILADAPKTTANDLLIRSVSSSGSDHIASVRLALSQGADPNATTAPSGRRSTALGISAAGFNETSLQAVRLLLAAGADVNLMSDDRRPIWQAANTMMLSRTWNEVNDRAKQIFLILVHAGADLKLPNADGKPPIWSMLFPIKYDPGKLDPMFVTPDLLRLFVDNGMDINARWNGRLVLSEVERQAGPNSKLAQDLRACGAHN